MKSYPSLNTSIELGASGARARAGTDEEHVQEQEQKLQQGKSKSMSKIRSKSQSNRSSKSKSRSSSRSKTTKQHCKESMPQITTLFAFVMGGGTPAGEYSGVGIIAHQNISARTPATRTLNPNAQTLKPRNLTPKLQNIHVVLWSMLYELSEATGRAHNPPQEKQNPQKILNPKLYTRDPKL